MNIALWSDGTFCDADEVAEYGWKSDDYEVLSVAEALQREDIRADLEEYGYEVDD